MDTPRHRGSISSLKSWALLFRYRTPWAKEIVGSFKILGLSIWLIFNLLLTSRFWPCYVLFFGASRVQKPESNSSSETEERQPGQGCSGVFQHRVQPTRGREEPDLIAAIAPGQRSPSVHKNWGEDLLDGTWKPAGFTECRTSHRDVMALKPSPVMVGLWYFMIGFVTQFVTLYCLLVNQQC